jgi:hypothetical protein
MNLSPIFRFAHDGDMVTQTQTLRWQRPPAVTVTILLFDSSSLPP